MMGILPFWLPGFVKVIMLKLYFFVCIAEINILLLLSIRNRLPVCTAIVMKLKLLCGRSTKTR